MVAVRRTTPEDLEYGLKYLSQLVAYSEANQARLYSSGPSYLTDHLISWLKDSDQSYN